MATVTSVAHHMVIIYRWYYTVKKMKCLRARMAV